MPSIPQSLLWISLVVLWLFVLVPMLINKRDTVRRTSDVALATRVLNGRAKSRLIKRSGPAAGHRHDPDWQRDDQFVEDYPDEVGDYAEQRDVIREYDEAVREARMTSRSRSVMVVAAVTEQTITEPDYLDVDIVDENSGALPMGETGVQASLFDPPLQESDGPTVDAGADATADTSADAGDWDAEDDWEGELPEEPIAEPIRARTPRDVTADEYEYVDDTSGLEDEYEDPAPVSAPRTSNRERRLSNNTAAAVSARKYRFRKRVLMGMAALLMLTAVLSFTVSPTLWWACGAVAGVTVLYLGYLRRQTRIEEQVRRRRQQRMARSRPVFEEPAARRPEADFTEFPTRLQRPGAVVLEIDDEDPVFEHLDEVAYSRRPYGRTQGPTRDLPRASGQ